MAREPPGVHLPAICVSYGAVGHRGRSVDLTQEEHGLVDEFRGIFSPETVLEVMGETTD